jgi:hypothetical protein
MYRRKQVIERAFKRHAKPDIALQLVMAAAEPGSPGVPEPLAAMIETVVRWPARRRNAATPPATVMASKFRNTGAKT